MTAIRFPYPLIQLSLFVGLNLLLHGAAQAGPGAGLLRGNRPTQSHQIQITAFVWYISYIKKEGGFTRLDDDTTGPVFLCLVRSNPRCEVIESVRRVFAVARPKTQMEAVKRQWLKHNQPGPEMFIPGILVSIDHIQRNDPAHADVTIGYKFNPTGDSDYGASEKVVLHLIRSGGKWVVKSKKQLWVAG